MTEEQREKQLIEDIARRFATAAGFYHGDWRAWEGLAESVIRYVRAYDAGTAEGNPETTCEWWNDGEMWESSCGVAYMFNSDGPEDNGHRFCHKCGKPIAIGETPK